MQAWARQGQRFAVTLIPLLVALAHALGLVQIGTVTRLDDSIYDARLRATMPATLDERIVIVDIDEKSLAEVGRWPWSRNKLALLVDQLFARQHIALLGMEVVFAEPDDSSGLPQLRHLAATDLRDQPGFAASVARLQASLDYDALFARSLQGRPVVLGYYFTSDRDGRRAGVLPQPATEHAALAGRQTGATRWTGYGASMAQLAQAAPKAGFFNAYPDPSDGLVRSLPMLARFEQKVYESLALRMYRALPGSGQQRALAFGEDLTALVPFRGSGGPAGGSFRYLSAAAVLAGTVPAGSLQGKIVLLGTTAPGLQDLYHTPVGEAYPGVEVHANALSGLLDGRQLVQPDYALAYEVLVLLVSGLLLAFALPRLSAPKAVLLSALVVVGLVALNFGLYASAGLVLPLASALLTALAAFVVNMSYGYLVESRAKRQLARLFGTYVPPELVDEMVKDPERYNMVASNQELTVLFCDMRGFTNIAETMEPLQLQQMLNDVFSQLTQVIRAHRGTIDKYMGDCVMAFWGAPVALPDHAELALQAALRMVEVVAAINRSHLARGLPAIGIGIGINTGMMCVGDMGSQERQAYTVIGDAVNLGSRLEALSRNYGVDTVVSASTRALLPGYAWQELDRVRVKGKQNAVSVHTPLGLRAALDAGQARELLFWEQMLQAYRAQDWANCDAHLLNLLALDPGKSLYHLYRDRLDRLRTTAPVPGWDGVTHFETK